MSTSISFINVFANYSNKGKDLRAVENFSLNIEKGDFVGILGESGCGKSTILRLAAGLLAPSQGQVKVNDDEVTGVGKRTGYVFQGTSLLPWLTVYQNIALGYKIRGAAPPSERIMEVISMVGLQGFEDSRPHTLSGGMAQRTAIARALVDSPDLLLLDEPFSALDAITRSELQQELLQIVARLSITTILVTHDFDEVIRLSNRIVLLTPRPGSIFKEYSNDRTDLVSAIGLRQNITDDIYKARKLNAHRSIGAP